MTRKPYSSYALGNALEKLYYAQAAYNAAIGDKSKKLTIHEIRELRAELKRCMRIADDLEQKA
jgi:hypothetical protein